MKNLKPGTKIKILNNEPYNGVVTTIITAQCHTPKHCYCVDIDHFAGDYYNVDKNEVEVLKTT